MSSQPEPHCRPAPTVAAKATPRWPGWPQKATQAHPPQRTPSRRPRHRVGRPTSRPFRRSKACASSRFTFPPCPDRLGLYPVVPTADWIERLLELGVRTIQLRSKSTDGALLDAEIARAVRAARAHDARLFINDHWRRAIDAGAYGVHLGQEDLQHADLEAIARAGLRLGLSTHGFHEMRVALHFRPSYLAMGAVFPTTTKQMPTARRAWSGSRTMSHCCAARCRSSRSAASTSQ